MTYDELVQETLVIVKRPDLLDQIGRAVRASTLKAHNSDFFYRDVVEKSVEFSEPARIIKFNPKQIYPRFRKPRYIRIWNYDESDTQNWGHPGLDIKSEVIGNLKDAYGYDKTEIYYMAGDSLNIRCSAELSHILFAFYQYPDTNPDTFESWIADECPAAIYQEAARNVFKSIGFDEQSAEQNNLVAEAYRQLTIYSIAQEE